MLPRPSFKSTKPIIWLALLVFVDGAQAGLVHRHIRTENVKVAAGAASADLAPADNLIPVVIIEDGAPLAGEKAELQKIKQSEEVIAPAAAHALTPEKVDDEKVSALLGSERLEDEKKIIIQQEIKKAVAEEESIKEELIRAAELENKAPAALEELSAAAIYFKAPEIASAAAELAQSLPADSLPAETQSAPIPAASPAADEKAPTELVRQAAAAAATQATPTQTTTPPNFVQQLIQNSPIGQFFGQLTGQPQQQGGQNTQAAGDQPANPAPTLPGFLNPQNAITQVQNAAQGVANATAQALQGVQQFASNLGTQFQNTLSSLSGQQLQQQSNSDLTTTRPPGPIQSLFNNFVGGNQPSAGATAAVGATQNPAQQQGPLQGIFGFLQGGGNRPPNAAVAVAGSDGSAAAIGPASAAAPAADTVNNNALTDAEQEGGEAQDGAYQTDNEVRNSAEVVSSVDSFEDNSSGGQFIIVNDDVSSQQQEQGDEVKAAADI